MKPANWQLDPASYPWTEEVPSRFGDIDMFGHLNNVAIARLFEEGRVRFQYRQYGLRMLEPDALKELRMVVAQSNISYLREGAYPAPVRCGAGIARLGRSSYTVWSALWQDGQALSFQECVMVVQGPAGTMALPDELRQQMQPWLIQHPQEAS